MNIGQVSGMAGPERTAKAPPRRVTLVSGGAGDRLTAVG